MNETQFQSLLSESEIEFSSSSLIDFNKKTFRCFGDQELIFDLASLTKPLYMGALALELDLSQELLLLSEHKSGLPTWALMDKSSWKDYVTGFGIVESETKYSDIGALRFMLECERLYPAEIQKLEGSLKSFGVKNWKELSLNEKLLSAPTGYRKGELIQGEVHDPNAWIIKDRCFHAGLFSSVQDLSEYLLHYAEKASLLERMKKEIPKRADQRFVLGWDRALSDSTLAGRGCGEHCFGHLGFTGTSVWVDAKRGFGHVLLSNAVRSSYHDKTKINQLRRRFGELAWKSFEN